MDIRITHIISLDASLMGLLVSAANGAIAVNGAGAPVAKPATIPTSDAAAGTEGKDLEAKATDTVNGVAESADGVLDAGGHPWSADLHASTKGVTKDGFWRMKVGVSRPANAPGFPKETGGTGTASTGAGSPATGTAASTTAGPATSAVEDEDEFAAFRAAADKQAGTDAAAAASVPARKWTDADLGALCNQAAVKLGDPAPVKAIIEQFAAAGETPHSRNIPDDKREMFAKAVEAKAEITFAG